MSVYGISGATPSSGPAAAEPLSLRDRVQHALDSVAHLFGTTTDDLETQLRGGQSLAGLADAKHGSRDDLLAAIKTGLTDNLPQGAAPPSDAVLTRLANRVADHVGGPLGTRRPGDAAPAAPTVDRDGDRAGETGASGDATAKPPITSDTDINAVLTRIQARISSTNNIAAWMTDANPTTSGTVDHVG